MTERIFPYSVLTDTESIYVFFNLICKPESNLPGENFRDLLFEVIGENESLHWFDTSRKFCEKVSGRDKSLKKKLDDPCFITIAVNPKEYFEKFESENINKKHKGLRKGTQGMEFENYSRQINSIKEI